METYYRSRDPASAIQRFRFDSVHRHHYTKALFEMFAPFPKGYCRCCGITDDGSRYSTANSVGLALEDYYAGINEILTSASLKDLRSNDIHPSKHVSCFCRSASDGAKSISDLPTCHESASECFSVMEVTPKKRKLSLVCLDDSSSVSFDELE